MTNQIENCTDSAKPASRLPTYPNDIPPQQIEDLISGATSLQNQILRKFARAVLEEMRYHLWVAQEKCKMFETEISELRAKIDTLEREAATRTDGDSTR